MGCEEGKCDWILPALAGGGLAFVIIACALWKAMKVRMCCIAS